MLSATEAKLFDALCSLVVDGVPFIFAEREEFLKGKGLGFSERHLLAQAGLIQVHETGVQRIGHRGALLMLPIGDGPMLVGLAHTPQTPLNYQLGTVMLTQAGSELSRLWRGAADVGHLDWVGNKFRSIGFQWATVSRARNPDGSYRLGAYPQFLLDFFAAGGLKDSA